MTAATENPSSRMMQLVIGEAIAGIANTGKATPPAEVEEARLDLMAAELELEKCAEVNAKRARQRRDLNTQNDDLQLKAEEEFSATGSISKETSIALNSLEKSLARAKIAAAEDETPLNAARQNVDLRRAIFERAAQKWAIWDADGPAAEANDLIRSYLEALPFVLLKSAIIYDEARTKFGWQPHTWPLTYWHGPGGHLLDAMQNIEWADWPSSVRPSWAPQYGPRRDIGEFLADYRAELGRATEKTSLTPASEEAIDEAA